MIEPRVPWRLLPTGVRALGRCSPGCTGALAIGADSMSKTGSAAFTLICGDPRRTRGGLALGARGLT